jgi:gamma-glutamylcyclotransferase (GGCT)/AIG2-like uncharacterized protein YtfP
MNNNKVFVYGTLKKGNSVRGLNMFRDRGVEYVSDAVTTEAEFSLYDLGAFPAVTSSGNNRISGEVWEVDENMMKVLDDIEGYPEFYNRMEIKTTQGKAWMYYIPDIKSFRTNYIEPDHNNIASWRNK